ncbi:hypothetical protein DL771_010009 [Monosporascus sp. 5C6A]|nr:hypothetical protein DL771_010009 [Monosporascus sp. 5C6A]
MCGTENEAASPAPNVAHPVQNHNPASSPYQRVDDYLSNVSRYQIIEKMKCRIATMLSDFGADYIELTSPVSSPQSYEDCKTICKLGLKSKILTHVRCNMEDAKKAVECGVDGVDIVFGTSSFLREFNHGKSMEMIQEANTWSSGVADTVGGATPRMVYDLIRTLRETHFHNDTGCAVGNALTALEAGATHVDTSVLGIGERNGITPLGALMARMVVTSPEYTKSKYNLKMLKQIEEYVASTVQVNIPFNNPITGFCAFTHKAGVHSKAILANPSTYEIIDPSLFGYDQIKEVTAKIKQMADIRPLAIDDTDSIIHSYHLSLLQEKVA